MKKLYAWLPALIVLCAVALIAADLTLSEYDSINIGQDNLVRLTRTTDDQLQFQDINNLPAIDLDDLFNKAGNETVTGNSTFSGTVTNSGAVTNSSTTTFGGAITLDGIATDFTSDTNEDITIDPNGTGQVVITSPSVVEGDTTSFQAGHGDLTTTTDGYLTSGGVTHTSTVGIPMTSAGSILEIAVCANVSAFTTTGTLTYEVRKNNTAVFNVVSGSITGTGVQALNATQARAVDTFAQGDLLQVYLDKTDSFSGTVNGIAAVEVVFDD